MFLENSVSNLKYILNFWVNLSRTLNEERESPVTKTEKRQGTLVSSTPNSEAGAVPIEINIWHALSGHTRVINAWELTLPHLWMLLKVALAF